MGKDTLSICGCFFCWKKLFERQRYETMDVQKNTCFTVYSQKLAGKLMIKGFILVELGNDKMNPEKHVFYFKDTPLLRDAVNEYMIAHKR